ncbi:hypothetical protein IV38_GL000107 [Lactobacillus selangorensis]|uniref:Uncharacterized protein n=1 Tax=Lactobacillus selangorensis TaxID=81857 RepID=A0A0R2G1C7_9LACO|nr:hypothetical protein [Lactobacillus selangorensis]KRN29227.1 hypothetical protein IV38_GL000107 [Lactobacillus selangorensis]KRN31415.1 hypothetical protein IV40_GL001411 [Lactobacillus selangorensis]
MTGIDSMIKKSLELNEKYKEHFKKEIPDSVVWWDPFNISSYPNEFKSGLEAMERDVNKAIATDVPFEDVQPKDDLHSIY